MMAASNAAARRQRGAALLVFMLVVVVATSVILLGAVRRDAQITRRQTDTREVLNVARQALLDYALLRSDRGDGVPFALPCPDIDDSGGFADGEAHTSACGAPGVTVAGRLPWRTLGVPALRDAAGSCLWYVVSGGWKDAGAQTAAMINEDSNGALRLYDVESGALLAGSRPADRPVAAIIAPLQPVAAQTRPPSMPGRECAPGAVADDYLDTDVASGISNASLSGIPDTIDVLAATSGRQATHNDRIATVSRADIARYAAARPDFTARLRDLGLAAAACVADYAAHNPGGANDRRLPWPTGVALADYRVDASYDDTASGPASGRLADIVDDSNAVTGNAIARVLSDCDPVAVPAWNASTAARWSHWKDHFFYAVAPSFAPDAAVPSACSSCLTVNGAGAYAAVIVFANMRLDGQVRDAPPLDADTRQFAANYLEGANATVPGTVTDFVSGAATATFNDMLFCIDPALVVSEC